MTEVSKYLKKKKNPKMGPIIGHVCYYIAHKTSVRTHITIVRVQKTKVYVHKTAIWAHFTQNINAKLISVL